MNRLYIKESIEISSISEKAKIIIVDGKDMDSKRTFLKEMEKAFCIPRPCKNWDAFIDDMTDLEWLDSNNIMLIIKNQKDFLCMDYKLREFVINIFEEDILPFWEKEVLYVVVDGKTKKFSVYLVDEVIL